MSLSGSPIVNHGTATSSPQVLIPLGNGQVRATFLQLSCRFLFNFHFRKMSITKSSFHERRTKGTLRKNDGNCKNKAYHKCMYMFKAFNAVAVAAANTREFKMPLRRREQECQNTIR